MFMYIDGRVKQGKLVIHLYVQMNEPRVKCYKCKNRTFAELTESVIEDHLIGKEVIGVYPMLSDENCKFLAIDFDGTNWQKDVTTIRQVCIEKSIPLQGTSHPK